MTQQIIVIKNTKNVGISIILTFLLGPLGMLYSTIFGGIFMTMVSIIVALSTVGAGLLVVWPICIIWAAISTNRYNKNLTDKQEIPNQKHRQKDIIIGFGILFVIIIAALIKHDKTDNSKISSGTDNNSKISSGPEPQKIETEKERKERIKLENLKKMGIWKIQYYVDHFGEPTTNPYIITSIRGTFSNTATQNSKLNVDFLINNSSEIFIQLYEYAGNNPVKAYSEVVYIVLVQDKNRNRLVLKAKNYSSDRLKFNQIESKKIHDILMKGGTIKFRIQEIETPTTQYKFDIQNANWYNNAYRNGLQKGLKPTLQKGLKPTLCGHKLSHKFHILSNNKYISGTNNFDEARKMMKLHKNGSIMKIY